MAKLTPRACCISALAAVLPGGLLILAVWALLNRSVQHRGLTIQQRLWLRRIAIGSFIALFILGLYLTQPDCTIHPSQCRD